MIVLKISNFFLFWFRFYFILFFPLNQLHPPSRRILEDPRVMNQSFERCRLKIRVLLLGDPFRDGP